MQPESKQPATSVADQEPQQVEGIQPGLADRAEAIGSVERTRAKIGKLAAESREVTADEHGNLLLTPPKVEEEKSYRELHNGRAT